MDVFLHDLELICLDTFKWFLVLLSNTSSFIFTQLNGFKYCNQTLIVLFAHNQMVLSIVI